jgi:hypothetical protein
MNRRARSRCIVLAACLLALSLGSADRASAHVVKRSGPFVVELGWGVEPPQTDTQNFVEVSVSDRQGAPVAVPAGALSVEVDYDDDAVTLPLLPTEEPGSLEGQLTPTRPGTYTFKVSGSVHGQPLDVSATCSESTFECVATSAGPEFPAKDPSAGELALRLSSEAKRVEDAGDRADDARSLAIVALALAAIALAVAIRATRRRGGG